MTIGDKISLERIAESVETLRGIGEDIHDLNRNWWYDIKTGDPLDRNFGEMIALTHSELSEALEGHRKNLMDSHLTHRKSIEVELADAIIRILDLGEGLGLNIGAALYEKCVYNAERADHKVENRLKKNGKKY